MKHDKQSEFVFKPHLLVFQLQALVTRSFSQGLLYHYLFADEAVSIREGKREARSDDAPSAKRPALVADSEHRESSEASPSPASEQGTAAKPGLVKTGSLEQTLICQICQVHNMQSTLSHLVLRAF